MNESLMMSAAQLGLDAQDNADLGVSSRQLMCSAWVSVLHRQQAKGTSKG
jgi:hypothetical protein